jgi:hypothetical protein
LPFRSPPFAGLILTEGWSNPKSPATAPGMGGQNRGNRLSAVAAIDVAKLVIDAQHEARVRGRWARPRLGPC